jgi:hypothetical protein
MSTLLEQALQKVSTLPREEQDAIAAQILDRIGEEEACPSLRHGGRNLSGWPRRLATSMSAV